LPTPSTHTSVRVRVRVRVRVGVRVRVRVRVRVGVRVRGVVIRVSATATVKYAGKKEDSKISLCKVYPRNVKFFRDEISQISPVEIRKSSF